jgi:hypothetical protein
MVQLVGGGSSIWPKLLQKLLHIDQNIILGGGGSSNGVMS